MRDSLLNDFAIRSFRDMVDRDYIHARLAYRARLIPQFLWSALHCLEKYAKCILLLNRVPAQRVRHEVSGALRLMEQSGPFNIPLCEQTSQFIERLESGAEFRYFEVSYWNIEHDIVRLDRAVWEVRRYCQGLNHDIQIEGRTINALAMNLQRVRLAQEREEKGTCIMSGWLETVIGDTAHSAREPLLWNNLHFGLSSRKRVHIVGYMESGNSPLYMHPEILDDVLQYVHLPKRVVKAWREELAKPSGRMNGRGDG